MDEGGHLTRVLGSHRLDLCPGGGALSALSNRAPDRAEPIRWLSTMGAGTGVSAVGRWPVAGAERRCALEPGPRGPGTGSSRKQSLASRCPENMLTI